MNKTKNLFESLKILNPGSWMLMAVMSACGVQTQSPQTEQAQGFELAEVSEGLQVRGIAPQEFGGVWAREFVLPGSENLVSLERQIEGQDSWEALGFSNDDGVARDSRVNSLRLSRYRIGGQLITPWFPALRDLDLEGRFCPEAPIAATRVRVAKDKSYVTGACSLTIQAEEFILEGSLKSFDQPGPGYNAGDLMITARRILGSGVLHWVGQSGSDGPTGAAGAPGKNGRPQVGKADGTNGQQGHAGGRGSDGGSGGQVALVFEELSFPAHQISVAGGTGGAGGAGGPGGPGGSGAQYEDCRLVGGRDGELICETKFGKSGRPGATGPRGSAGQSGSSGTLVMTRQAF